MADVTSFLLASPLLLLALFAKAPPAPQSSVPPEASDLGAERCVDCHASIVAAYAQTGMARALGPLLAGEFEGLAEVPAGLQGPLLERLAAVWLGSIAVNQLVPPRDVLRLA